ncbi:hypothetical protein pb186bvf_003901 [Paramecium bursaria]
MADKNKELFLKAADFIKKEMWKEAQGYLDILLMKDSKKYEYNLYNGLCLQRMGNIKSALDNYLYCLHSKPDDYRGLSSLVKLFRDDIKNYEKAQEYSQQLVALFKKTDKKKAFDAQVELCDLQLKNQERSDVLEKNFIEILQGGNHEQALKVSKIYIPLAIDLKKIDPNSLDDKNMGFFRDLSMKIKNQVIKFEELEFIMEKVLYKIKDKYRRPDLTIEKDHYDLLLAYLRLFPQSLFLLDEVLSFVHCFLDRDLKFILEQSIMLLIQKVHTDLQLESGIMYQNYPDKEEYPLQRVSYKARIFVSFIKIFASQYIGDFNQGIQIAVDQLIQQKQIDLLEGETSFFLEMPLRSQQLFKSGQPGQIEQSAKILRDLINKIKIIKSREFDISLLEEVVANLSFEVLVDPIELIDMKNLLKVRIKTKAYSLDTYEKYFDYQMKLVHINRTYDEEIPMQILFDKILQDDKNNVKIQLQQIWLRFSEKKFNIQEAIDKLLQFDQKQIFVLKRLASLYLIEQNLEKAEEYLQKCAILVDDFDIHMQLGMIRFQQKQYTECIERLYRAFNLCQTNYHLNQMILFVLSKIGLKGKALEFAINIYKLPQFNNVFWLSFTIGQYLMQEGHFNKAHEILQKACDQFQFNLDKKHKLYYEKKQDFEGFSIPYLINQNDNFFLCDYVVFSSQFYNSNNMVLLTEQYFKENQQVKQFRLEMKLAEIKKLLGLQGSALKSLERAQSILCDGQGHLIQSLEQNLSDRNTDNQLLKFIIGFNDLTINSKWVESIKQQKISLQYASQIMLLNFEASQLWFFVQNDYYSHERMIWGLLLGYHLNDEETLKLVYSYIPFIFEIATSKIKYQLKNYGPQSAQYYVERYLKLFQLVSDKIQNNIYTYDCLREFFYISGIIESQSNHFEQSLLYANKLVNRFTEMNIDGDFNVNEAFQQIRHSLVDNEKKQLILKNNLYSMILSTLSLGKQCNKIIQLSISLFPEAEVFYVLASLQTNEIDLKAGFLLKAIEINPKYQLALINLGLIMMQTQNFDFAQQLFSKCIESEPTTSSHAYLGLAIIGLIYLQQNKNIQLGKENYLRQFDELQSTQRQLESKIQSYLNYISTLENSEIQNIVSIIYKSLYMGSTISSDSILAQSKQFISMLPIEFQQLLSQQLDNTYKQDSIQKFNSFDEIEQEIDKITNKIDLSQNHEQEARLLRYIIILRYQQLEYSDYNQTIKINNEFISFIRLRIKSSIRYATQIFNYNTIMIGYIEKLYHKIRTYYLDSKNDKQYFLYVSNLKELFEKTYKEQQQSQILNYIDMIHVQSQERMTSDLSFNLSFMESIVNDVPTAKKYIQQLILFNPGEKNYRYIYSMMSGNTNFKQGLLEMNCTDQSLNWIFLLQEQVHKQKNLKVGTLLRIVKYKIQPYLDHKKAKYIIKILFDLFNQSDQNEILVIIKEIQQQFKLDITSMELKSQIQQLIYQKQFKKVFNLIVKLKELLVDKLEDYQQSKKISNILTPILTQLSQQYEIKQIIRETLQNSLYAQQSLLSDQKMKRSRFILNTILYTQLLRDLRLNNPDTIAETLIELKDISDEFLSQGTFNQEAISLYIHYSISVEKYDELDTWLKNREGYLSGYNDLVRWGYIIQGYKQVKQNKTLISLKEFLKLTEQFKFTQIPLQAMIQYLIAESMSSISNWIQQFGAEEVLKRYQVACLIYPTQNSDIKEILKVLTPQRKPKQQKKKMKPILLQDQLDIKLRKKSKKHNDDDDGLNSDSDEDVIQKMDMEQDIDELNQERGLILGEGGIYYYKDDKGDLQQYIPELDPQFNPHLYEDPQQFDPAYDQNYDNTQYEQDPAVQQDQIEQFEQPTYEQIYEQMKLQGYTDDQIVNYFNGQ